jgi:Tol biopolymer transport system component/tRNA A-37 threonylcarbamoyl transferase component Bud32
VADPLEQLKQALADRYTIERELGRGGMAIVYLAQDLRHHRKVALKVLRPELAAALGPERFLREIEVAARLQHPNILPLLDSGEAAGFFFYVMPFIDGESLRERLARSGEFAIPDAVRILVEVADALSHAHAHGVVHRDIKPGNVLLSGRHALVADFGVAKAVTEATGHELLTSSGVALGTPAYMAPEQATADPHQDHRADIYALGVLGYELLTGRVPFSATTAQEMLAAHVTMEPEPLERHRPTVPPALTQVIMKCLAKKPADRWQTADELLTHLEPLATPSGGTTPTQIPPTMSLARLPRWVPWAGGVAVLVVVALVVGQLVKSRPLSITASDITPVTKEPGVEFEPAISPDGNEVAYVAGPIGLPRLFLRSTVNVASGASVRLGDTALGTEWFPRWTQDGQSVRFWGCPGSGSYFAPSCAIRESGKLGGAVQTVPVPPGSGWSWSPDGTRIAFVRADTIFTSSGTDGRARRLTIHKAEPADLHTLVWSPDGQRIAYVNGNSLWRLSGNVAESSIWIVDADGGEPQRVTTRQALNVSPAWLDARHLLFVSNRDGARAVYLVEVGANGARGLPRLIPGVADPHSISYSIKSRRLAFAKFTVSQNIWAYPLDRSAPISIRDGRPVTTGNQVIEAHDVSPDGKWIAYNSSLRGKADLYKVPLGGGEPVPLSTSSWDEFAPRWSPDGKEIAAYTRSTAGIEDIMVIPSDGGTAVSLTNGLLGLTEFPSWSPDGLAIAFHSDRKGQVRLWLVSRDSVGGAWHKAVQLGDFPCSGATWAPDGSGVVCGDGNDLVFVSPQGRMLWRRDLSATFGLTLQSWPRHSRDGRTLYVAGVNRDGRQGVWAIPVAGGAPRLVVTYDDPALHHAFRLFSVGPDRLYLTVAQYESDIWVAKLDW